MAERSLAIGTVEPLSAQPAPQEQAAAAPAYTPPTPQAAAVTPPTVTPQPTPPPDTSASERGVALDGPVTGAVGPLVAMNPRR